MSRFFFSLFLIALCAAPLPGFGLEGVEVVASAGALRQEIYGAPSPTPGYCYWDLDADADPTFHATNADGYGNTGCPDPWLVHGDSDSLSFRGSWPLNDGIYVLSSAYRVSLSLTIAFAADMLITAAREVSGDLDVDIHAMTIGFSDGAEIELLAAGTGPDRTQMVVPRGTYLVTLTVDAFKSGRTEHVIGPYEGAVVMAWEESGGVAAEPLGWGRLKAFFR